MRTRPELLHRVEVAVEGGRHDARLARDLAQAEAAEALALQQPQRRVEQGDARALLLLAPRERCLAVHRIVCPMSHTLPGQAAADSVACAQVFTRNSRHTTHLAALLGSALAEALTTPHGVDRYVELVRPAFSLREVRAEVVAVRRATARSVTLTLRPNANWQGFRAGQFVRLSVEIDGVRHTRCYSPASSAPRRRPARADRARAARRRTSRRSCAERAARHGRLALAGRGRLRAARRAPARAAADQRRQRHHAGHVDAADALRGGPRRPDRLPALRPRRARRRLRDELARSPPRHPNVRLLRGFTRGPRAGELRRPLRPRARARGGHRPGRGADVRVRADRAPRRGAHDVGAGRAGRAPARRAASRRRRPRTSRRTASSPAACASRAAGARRRAPARRCSTRPRPPASTPQSGCRMGICHTCTCRKLEGAVRDVRTGEISTAPDELIQICVNAPVGDVTLDI